MENKIEIYTSPNQQVQIQVQLDEDTVWLTQDQILELFQSNKANISKHLTSIFSSGERDLSTTVRKIRTVHQEGKRTVARNPEYYNLDVIISLGYRVNTKRGIHFRQWATQRLKEYLIKDYSINLKRKDLELVEYIGSGIQRILQLYDKDSSQFSKNFLCVVFYTDAELAKLDTPHDTPHDEKITRLLLVLEDAMSRSRLQKLMKIKNRKYFRENYLVPAMQLGYIEPIGIYTPKNKNQKYRLTEKVKQLKNLLITEQ